MKIFKLFFLFFFTTSLIYSQSDIVNTLGAGGVFKIKDGSTTFFSLNQSDGRITLPLTISPSLGVIFKGAERFIHDFKPVGAPGRNTFVGINSGNFTMSFSSDFDASYNTGVGYGSLTSLTTGCNNTASGYNSLSHNTLGSENTAYGIYSLYSHTIGNFNTAVGGYALYSDLTGYGNTALGDKSLYSNISGVENTAAGNGSLYLNTTGFNNSAFGYSSLFNNTTGFLNTASGYNSLFSNTTGHDNTSSGYASLYHNTTGYFNTALDSGALLSNTIGLYNVASGYRSLFLNETGYDNTASGVYSLENNTEGFYNTALGSRTGSTITTGNNLTCLGFDAEPTSGTATNQITLGNSSIASLRCNVQNISSLSDARDKKNITDLTLGLDFITKLKPRQFNWDKREWYEGNISNGSKMKEEPTAGFIAQELDEVQTTENAEWLNLVLKDNPEKLEATPGNLLPIIVKAIQDLKKENDELKTRLTKFEQMGNILTAEIEKLKTDNNKISKVSLGEQ